MLRIHPGYVWHARLYFGPGTIYQTKPSVALAGLLGQSHSLALAQLWLCQPNSGLQFRF